ncbi:expressed unknown protein [Seminavis robusta]|uniref:PDZ domain-containing protein n=1 Tax=Seminavis robusta TaxID=568900 RepID=A0A9N8HGT9_9STRA|nr:expressed unknown protein [Seminavis robusta]|eukprot:Sro503_g155720.1 n/a (350) ;mRNA; r:6121-7170
MTLASSSTATATAVSLRSYDDCCDVEDFPTVRLSSGAEEVAMVNHTLSDIDDEEIAIFVEEMGAALAVAEQIPVSMRDVDILSMRRIHKYEEARAEFISAHFVKAHSPKTLGIQFGNTSNDNKGTTIVKIHKQSLAAQSPLQVGDTLVSINRRQCSPDMTPAQVDKLLREEFRLKDNVTLVAHNPGGACDVVESMFTKPNPHDVVGIGLEKDPHSNKLIISIVNTSKRVDATTKAAASLLNIGDEVISINGFATERIEYAEALEIIKTAPKTVTVKAITLRETGIVLGEIPTQPDSTDGVIEDPKPRRTRPTKTKTKTKTNKGTSKPIDCEMMCKTFVRVCKKCVGVVP